MFDKYDDKYAIIFTQEEIDFIYRISWFVGGSPAYHRGTWSSNKKNNDVISKFNKIKSDKTEVYNIRGAIEFT